MQDRTIRLQVKKGYTYKIGLGRFAVVVVANENTFSQQFELELESFFS
jgi:hypothetical protein